MTEHIFLCILFIISVFVILKNSNIPYGVLENVGIIHVAFDQFKGDFFQEISRVLEIFLSSYATGLMFYYIVDYIPEREIKEEAKKTLQPKLEKLYEEMTMFYEMYKTVAQSQNEWSENAKLDNVQYNNEIVYCKKVVDYGKIEYKYYFKFVDEGQKCIKNIKDRSEKICMLSYFLYLEEEQKNAISWLQDLELFNIFPKYEKDSVLGVDYGKRLKEFERYRQLIGSIISNRETFEFKLMDKTEEEQYKEEIVLIRKKVNAIGRSGILMYKGNKY